MSDETGVRAVFDCPIYAQALLNPHGPAARCISLAQAGRFTLSVSDYVLQEIRELPGKLKPRFRITTDHVERLIRDVMRYAQPVIDVPKVYVHPIDVDDSHYVDLAIASGTNFIVSRDRHLLNLMDVARDECEFLKRFPTLRVVDPIAFLQFLTPIA